MHQPTKRFEGTYSLSNWLVGTLLFLSWIGCIVGFAGPLHVVRTGKGPLSFYWDHVRFTGNIRPYETILPGNVQFQNENEVAEMCDSGGAGFLAMTVFAFLCLTAALGLWFLRTLNIKMKINREDSLKAEIALTACAFMFMLIAVIVWGATCYSYSNSRMNLTAVPRGWVYMIFTLFFMLAAIPLLTWMLRKTKHEPGLADMSARPELAYPDWHGWEESWFRRPGAPSTTAADRERERATAAGRDTARDREGYGYRDTRDRERGLTGIGTTAGTTGAAMTGLSASSATERDRERELQQMQQQQQMRDRPSTSTPTGFGREDWDRDRGMIAARQTEQEQRRDQPYMSALSHPGVSMTTMGPADRDMRDQQRDRGYFYDGTDRSRAPEKGLFGRERPSQREREPDYTPAMHAGYAPSRDRTGLRDYADRDREQEMMSMQRPQALRPLERPVSGMTESQPSQAHMVPIQTHSMLRDRGDRDTSSAAATSGSIPVSVSQQSQAQISTPSSAAAVTADTSGASSIPIHGLQKSPRQSRSTTSSLQTEPSVR